MFTTIEKWNVRDIVNIYLAGGKLDRGPTSNELAGEFFKLPMTKY